jgi:hypothetical protein
LQERVHRRYSPSQTERFFACPGSDALLQRVPARPESRYAKEGTAAHTVLEAALTSGAWTAAEGHENSTLFMYDLNNEYEDFYYAIDVALDYIKSALEEFPDAEMWVETFVDTPSPAAPGQAGGYCDVAIYSKSARLLRIIDYKHGAGIAKDAEANPQLMSYGAGFLYEDDSKVSPEDVDSVVLTIIQPRAFHKDGDTREWETTPFALYEYLDTLDFHIEQCQKDDAPLVPGEDQCRFCDARSVCPAREQQALQVASSAFHQIKDVAEPSLPDPKALNLRRLGLIRAHAAMLRKWLDDCEAHCEELARAGHSIPGAKLVNGQARRVWHGSEEETVRNLAALLGKSSPDDVYVKKLPTITDAERAVVAAYKQRVGRGRKRAAAEDAKHAFAYLTTKEASSTLKLVDLTDPRPSVSPGHHFSGLPLLPSPLGD